MDVYKPELKAQGKFPIIRTYQGKTKAEAIAEMDNIKILHIRLQGNGKPLKAFVDIAYEGLTIRDFRIIQQPGQKAYVVAPQTAWKGQQGKTNFKPIISMPNAVKWQIESAILAEYQRAREGSNEKNT